MDRLTEAIERRCKAGEVGAAVRLLERAGDGLVRTFKELVLQRLIDRTVWRELGDKRKKRRRRERLSPWSCARCGPRLGSELRRNGHYLRRPLTCEGSITLRIPQLVCNGCNKERALHAPLPAPPETALAGHGPAPGGALPGRLQLPCKQAVD